MPLSIGDKLGPYEILAPLGEGGMGEVYKARDTRLDRIVAVKVSKQEFTERFEREARAVSALNHPHVCQLYDVGATYLVMEHVEGSPLKGPLPLDKTLDYAKQIASALDAAHSKSVTHRDLKPDNILVTKSAGVKVLDFGLAKIDKPVSVDEATLATGLTAKGTILGTLFYMSPEQLNGLQADPRSDIFSFGLVLHEMITGKRAFDGATPASVIAAILERPAPSVVNVAPVTLDRVLKRCLEKDPENRWQTARDLRSALDLIEPDAQPAAGLSTPGIGRWLWPALAGTATLAALTLGVLHFRPAPAPALRIVRFQIAPPEKSTIDYFKVSPDGRQLAFTSDRRVWIQPLDSLQAQPLPGTEGAEQLFWSPDNQSIAFFAQNKLKRIAASGGPVQVICSVSQPHGGTWNRDGVIILPLGLTSGLFRVSASGGEPVQITKLGVQPEFLPDGQHFFYMVTAGETEGGGTYVGSLDGTPPTRLLTQFANTSFVPAANARGGDGYLLFRRDGTLMAQRFDTMRLALIGDALAIADTAGNPLWAAFSVAQDGTLVYAPGDEASTVQLAWWDRSGRQGNPFGPPGIYQNFRLAPDEKRITFSKREGNNLADVWTLDSVRAVTSRLTFDPAIDDPPLWSHDGTRVVWASNREGLFNLYAKSATGSGADQLLTEIRAPAGWPEDMSQDGGLLLYQTPSAKADQDLWIAPKPFESAGEDRKPYPYLHSGFDEKHGRFSPDGHWVVYTSNESGRDEVYLQSLPLSGAKVQISTGGGVEPQWRKDGKELFYIEDRALMAVPVQPASSPSEPPQIGQPKRLFSVPLVDTFIVGRTYEVSGGGQRFLLRSLASGVPAPPLTVVLNWSAQLKN
jgi:serine/threonine protein kinase